MGSYLSKLTGLHYEIRHDLGNTLASINVSKDPKAKPMYYLSCIRAVLDMEDVNNIDRLTDYDNFANLSVNETRELLILCHRFQPMYLTGKAIFQDTDDENGTPYNQFYEIDDVRQCIVVGKMARTVLAVMYFNAKWMDVNFLEPIESFRPERKTELPSVKPRLLERFAERVLKSEKPSANEKPINTKSTLENKSIDKTLK